MDETNKTFVQIDTIKPDPHQPRKIFLNDHIKGLAVSLTQEGMINPIEIDQEMRIITGECRWRAAKLLNWEEVPVIINSSKFDPYLRLRHQMAENVHQSGSTYDTMMNPMDTAKGFARLYELKYSKGYQPGEYPFIEKETPGGTQKVGAFELIANEIGIAKETVWELLKLLEQPEAVQKSIQEGTPRTYFREADKAPEGMRDKIKEKIVAGEYQNRREIEQDAHLARTIPDLAKVEIEREKGKASAYTNKILNEIAKLALAMEKQPLDKVDVRERGIVEKQLGWLLAQIDEYLAGATHTEQPEGEVK